jgi:hypothetical protein
MQGVLGTTQRKDDAAITGGEETLLDPLPGQFVEYSGGRRTNPCSRRLTNQRPIVREPATGHPQS